MQKALTYFCFSSGSHWESWGGHICWQSLCKCDSLLIDNLRSFEDFLCYNIMSLSLHKVFFPGLFPLTILRPQTETQERTRKPHLKWLSWTLSAVKGILQRACFSTLTLLIRKMLGEGSVHIYGEKFKFLTCL